MRICEGCGIPIQAEDPGRPGYVPPQALSRDHVICRRCFRIRHYNDVIPAALSADDYRAILERIGEQEALVVYIVDIFDLLGSWVRGLPRFIGDNPLVVVANKVDLLPASVNCVHIKSGLCRMLAEWGLHPLDVVLCSAMKNDNIDRVAETIERYREGRDVYVVGATNVGKSSFINQLLVQYGDGSGNEITTSVYPGTTLDTIRIALADGRELVDTPGIVNRDRLSELVAPEDLRVIVPRAPIKPKVYQLNAGQTLFFAGLARLDFKAGERQPFVCYIANDLYVHRTKTVHADELYRRHRGHMLSPPAKADDLPPFSKRSFRVKGEKTDIVISGLGWVVCRGDVADVDVYVPQGVAVSFRSALI